MAQALMVLSEYPEEVVCYVTDPRTGIQRYQKWPPTISEIAEACDSRVGQLKRQAKHDAWVIRRDITDKLRKYWEDHRFEIDAPWEVFLKRCEDEAIKRGIGGEIEQTKAH